MLLFQKIFLVPVRYLKDIFPDKRNKGTLLFIDYIANLASLHISNVSSPNCLMGNFTGMFPPVVKPLSHRESAVYIQGEKHLETSWEEAGILH